MNSLVRPDGFAIGLFAVGFIMLFVAMMLMPGVTAMLAAVAYWLHHDCREGRVSPTHLTAGSMSAMGGKLTLVTGVVPINFPQNNGVAR